MQSTAEVEANRPLRAAVFVATIFVIIAISVLPLLTPTFVHAALDAAGAAGRLGLTPSQAHELSDRSVGELLLGPGTFEIKAPGGGAFYDASERAHLQDARVLLWLFLGAGVLSALGLAAAFLGGGPLRRALWRPISWAGATSAIAVIVIGLVSLVAFDTLFTLFHEVFFPGGNWAFDASTQRLVQLYPYGFWQIAAGAFGLLVCLAGLVAWWLGRFLSRRELPPPSQSTASRPAG